MSRSCVLPRAFAGHSVTSSLEGAMVPRYRVAAADVDDGWMQEHHM